MSDVASPWKPCDLRGVFPSEVSEDLFERIGRAIGSEMAEGSLVVAGGDFRLSTPPLKSALINGLVSTGLRVMDVGQVPTPIVYFHASRVQAAAVFIVTASHNPAAHNGLKWMVGEMPPTPGDILRIRFAEAFRPGCGSVEVADPAPAYLEWLTSRWWNSPACRVVLDPGNGAWSLLAPEVFRALGFDVTCLHCSSDGRFANRPPDCARTANLSALREAVVDQGAALGIAWDGDGDRVAFVDETGAHASTDEISILLARHVLQSAAPSEPVVCDIKLSDAVRREVMRCGGFPMLERSGHAFMRSRLLSNRAILGLDACGHYFFREAGSRDDGLYSALYLVSMLGGASLAEMRATTGPMFSTPELRLPMSVLNFGTVRDRLRSTFPGAEESNIDGARLVLDEGVVLARESSTEAVVSLRIEGFSSGGYQKLVTHCLHVIARGGHVVTPPD